MVKSPTETEIKNAYRIQYIKTGSTAAAHNAVLDKFAGPYKPNASRAALARRQHVADLLRRAPDKVLTPAVRKKAGKKTITLYVHGLDVWGNKSDGYTVNDVYPSSGTIEILEDEGDRDVFEALKKAGFIDRNICFTSFHLDGSTVSDRFDKPVYELRAAHGVDWPK